jgi:exodeoxyribonuclease-3
VLSVGLTVSSVNVNGIRAAAQKGLARWLATTTAHVVCLQETRAQLDEVPAGLLAGWHLSYAACEDLRGRNGVGVLTREEPEAVRVGVGPGYDGPGYDGAGYDGAGYDGAGEFDGAGRYLEVDLPGVTIASLYLPNGTVGTAKQDEKDRFRALFAPYLAERREKAAAEDREVLVCGDWNIAPTEADIRNWRGNVKNSGFLPHERAWVAELLASGWVDVVRALHPGVDGPYSWWSYRGRAFDNNTGWRIDHHIATPALAAGARSADVERAATHGDRWSDHAPVTVTYGPAAGAPAGYPQA